MDKLYVCNIHDCEGFFAEDEDMVEVKIKKLIEDNPGVSKDGWIMFYTQDCKKIKVKEKTLISIYIEK